MVKSLKLNKAIETFISVVDMILVFKDMTPLSPENKKKIKNKFIELYAIPVSERPYSLTTDNLLNAIQNPHDNLLMESVGGAGGIFNAAVKRADSTSNEEGTGLICKKNSQGDKFNTSPNFRKCSHLWPNYPCYNNQNGSCEDASGTTNLDPIDDILYGAGEAYVFATNILGKFLGFSPSSKASEEKTIAWIRNYGTTITPVPSQLTRLDTARFLGPVISSMENKVNEYTRDRIEAWSRPAQPLGIAFETQGGGINNSLSNNKYLSIINPKTNKKVSIFSKKGRSILQKYMREIK